MKNTVINTLITVFIINFLTLTSAIAGDGGHTKWLHTNDKYDECSFFLDPSLTQKEWNRFSLEAASVTYFRPLTDAKPMGVGNYEFSVVIWETGIDDRDGAWDNTFSHPDSAHWLFDGDGLGFPGLMFRTGVTEKIDVGAYWVKNPGANYGFWGGQVQYNFVDDLQKNWAASARFSFTSLFGPKDLTYTVYGLEVLASREYAIYSDWISISPYAGFNTFLGSAHETTSKVNLKDENVLGVQGMIGATTSISMARLSVEYSFAVVNTFSVKFGIAF